MIVTEQMQSIFYIKKLLTIIEKLYGEFSIRMPSSIVPGLMVPDDFFTPSGGLQNGME